MRAAITGAATGIGAATVGKLKARGYDVTAFDIREPEGADLWVKVDLADPAAIEKAAACADGPFDCLINNAGLPPREGLSRSILAVNFLGLVKLTHCLEPKLRTGAAIVNTASRAGAGWRDNIEQVKRLIALDDVSELDRFIADERIGHVQAYNLSKEAVIAWGVANTERLIARGLRVNSVSPAAVSTGILDDFAAAFGDRMARNVARVGRPGTAEEVADLILFLVSEQSNWLKGNDFTIDGGMSALAACDQLGL